jgi:hypothetical protein
VRGFAVLLCILLLATAVGCGTSRSATRSTTKQTGTASPPATQNAPPPATSPSTQTTAPTATGTPPTAPETTTNPGAPATGGTPPEDARIPATYTIVSGGSLNPPTITAPAHIPVQLTVVSGDGRSHRVLLRTPKPRVLVVSAHGHATVLITALPLGRYALDVDGTPRGALVIGGAPGP